MATKKTIISNVPANRSTMKATPRASTGAALKAKLKSAAADNQLPAGTRTKIEKSRAKAKNATGKTYLLGTAIGAEVKRTVKAVVTGKRGSPTNPVVFDPLKAKPAAKKPTSVYTLEILRYKGFKIPVGRNSSNEMDAEIPTINVNTTAELVKLLEKLPKGCTWRTDEIDSINVYNRRGYLIVELRAPAK